MSLPLGILLATATVFPTGMFDCKMDTPRWLIDAPAGLEIRNLNFPSLVADDWKFSIEFGSAFGARITPVAKDPLGLQGEHGLVMTGENSFALASYGMSNCLLTDAGCATVLQVVPQSDKSLKLLALPSAIIFLDGAKTPEPFNAIVPGTCVPNEASK